MTIMKQLTTKQLESISGGNAMTFRAQYAAMQANRRSSGSSSSPAPSNSSNTLNFYGNGNAAQVIVQNVVLINSVLSIEILQGSGFC